MAATMKPNRRDILKTAGAVLGGLGLEPSSRGFAVEGQSTNRAVSQGHAIGLPKRWREMRKFDVHNHVMDSLDRPDAEWSKVENLIEAAELLGIEKLCCSRPITGGAMAEIQEVRKVDFRPRCRRDRVRVAYAVRLCRSLTGETRQPGVLARCRF